MGGELASALKARPHTPFMGIDVMVGVVRPRDSNRIGTIPHVLLLYMNDKRQRGLQQCSRKPSKSGDVGKG